MGAGAVPSEARSVQPAAPAAAAAQLAHCCVAPPRRFARGTCRAGGAVCDPAFGRLCRRYLLRELVVQYLTKQFPKWTAIDKALESEVGARACACRGGPAGVLAYRLGPGLAGRVGCAERQAAALAHRRAWAVVSSLGDGGAARH